MSSGGPVGLVTHGVSRKRKDRCSSDPSEPASTNWLLAGYLAHEFLTKGTLLGRVCVSDPSKPDPVTKPNPKPELEKAKALREYADVAKLMKVDGVHIPGIVNPTQLAQWLQM
ncbi:uncharacterized protein LOC120252701 [Dioscorea cayenensis subsp. rotundata]|uniref:Uncharacterized protein LOC120252701 n=1 Tax=Dioscorea cayennensis subsp. rotundata TaxID=55577 RepID=A0AB40AP96_DIOCR|nr:uncharacterized protein LOC120252701 [Dioscorea cayenensis subsp. rotundata]